MKTINPEEVRNTTDKARSDLASVFQVEYKKYIMTKLAGDFTVTLANKLFGDRLKK